MEQLMQDAVIIDPWHDNTKSTYYNLIGDFLLNNSDIEKIIIASYEDPRIDFALYGKLKDDPRLIIDENYDINLLNDDVWLLGQSWQSCLHGRSLGIPWLLRAEKSIWTTNQYVKKQINETNELIDVTDEQFENDWFVWSKDGDIWKCLADEKNVRDGNAHATTKEGNE